MGLEKRAHTNLPITVPLRVLLIEDSQDEAQVIVDELRRGGYEVVSERVDSAAGLETALRQAQWDLISCGSVLPGLGARAALELIGVHGGGAPVIVVSGEMGEESAVSLTKLGAHSFINKHKREGIVPAVERELREAESRRAHERADAALRASQANLQAILNNTLQSFVLMDTSGCIKAFNQIASVRSELFLLGVPLVENRSIFEFVPPAYDADFRRGFASALAGEVVVGERKIRDAGGADHWFEFNYIPVRGVDDEISGICLSVLDISEYKHTEEALCETQERLRSYIDQATDLIFTLDPTGKVTSVNRAVCQATGYAPEELIGRLVVELVVAESAALMQGLWKRIVNGDTADSAEVEIEGKNGRRLWVEIRGRTIVSGRRVETFHIARDITQRKRTEADNARLSAAVEQAAESIMITDPAGKIVYVNPACERMTGYSRAELYGQPPSLLTDGTDPDAQRRLAAALASGGLWRGVETQRAKNGSLYEVEIVISPVSDSSGRLINYVGLARHTT